MPPPLPALAPPAHIGAKARSPKHAPLSSPKYGEWEKQAKAIAASLPATAAPPAAVTAAAPGAAGGGGGKGAVLHARARQAEGHAKVAFRRTKRGLITHDIPNGDRVEVLAEEDGGWLRVDWQGMEGYVKQRNMVYEARPPPTAPRWRLPAVLDVVSLDRPALTGTYHLLTDQSSDRPVHNSQPVWCCATGTLYSTNRGRWMVTDDKRDMARNVGIARHSGFHQGCPPCYVRGDWEIADGRGGWRRGEFRIVFSTQPLRDMLDAEVGAASAAQVEDCFRSSDQCGRMALGPGAFRNWVEAVHRIAAEPVPGPLELEREVDRAMLRYDASSHDGQLDPCEAAQWLHESRALAKLRANDPAGPSRAGKKRGALDAIFPLSSTFLARLDDAFANLVSSEVTGQKFAASESAPGMVRSRMVAAAQQFAGAWRAKPGSVLDELLDNLVTPAAEGELVAPRVLIGEVAERLQERYGGRFPKASAPGPLGILVLVLYTQEGRDVDRMLGFDAVPATDDHAGVAAYATAHPARNRTLYRDVNDALREWVDRGAGTPSAELRRWARFVGVLAALAGGPASSVAGPAGGGGSVVHRGLHGLPRAVVLDHASLGKGDAMGWAAPASCSASARRVHGFAASGGRLQFEIEGARGLDLSQCSQYPKEEEVLLPPFATFAVQAVTVAGGAGAVSNLGKEQVPHVRLRYTGTLLSDPALESLREECLQDLASATQRLLGDATEVRRQEARMLRFLASEDKVRVSQRGLLVTQLAAASAGQAASVVLATWVVERGRCRWRVRLASAGGDGGASVFIGVIPREMGVVEQELIARGGDRSATRRIEGAWVLSGNTGSLGHRGDWGAGRGRHRALREGDTVEVHLDLTRGTVRFGLNEAAREGHPGFDGLPQGRYSPCVGTLCQGAALRLLDDAETYAA